MVIFVKGVLEGWGVKAASDRGTWSQTAPTASDMGTVLVSLSIFLNESFRFKDCIYSSPREVLV